MGATFLMLAGAIPEAASAQPIVGPGACLALPCDIAGELNGAAFKIRIPANWNRTLLVYLLGVKSPSNNPTEPPLVPPVLRNSEPPLEQTLLSRGYALAGTLVATQDMQLKEEVQDALALTAYLRGRVGDPDRVIVWGTSLGGLAALRLIEDFPRAFDAGIATCAPGAGMAKNMDLRLDFLLAYAAAFGWPDEWGTLGDLRTGLDFARDVNPKVQWPKPDGSNRGAWEFVRLVNGYSSDAFWNADPMWGSTGFGSTMWMATHLRESFEGWAAGPFTQNLDRRYTLKADENAYLNSLGVNADDLLAKMNARANIAASPRSRDFMERFGGVRGTPRRPVLTLHTTVDPTADVRHESAYRSLVETSGCSENLLQTYVDGVGHCAFTSRQLLTALAAVERWLETGVRPDSSFFPAAEGFNSGFVPAPYPY
jgi:pimeloyl-ACP methyl ester carboxylesterase